MKRRGRTRPACLSDDVLSAAAKAGATRLLQYHSFNLTKVTGMQNVTNSSNLITSKRQLIPTWDPKKGTGCKFVKEWNGQPLSQKVNWVLTAPIETNQRIKLLSDTELCYDPDGMEWHQFKPESGCIGKVFIEIDDQLIAFDLSNDPRAQFQHDLVGDHKARRLDFWTNQLKLNIDTLDYFGQRPTWVRRFDPVIRPELHLSLSIAASWDSDTIRITEGDVKVDHVTGFYEDSDTDEVLKFFKDFTKPIKIVGVTLDLVVSQ